MKSKMFVTPVCLLFTKYAAVAMFTFGLNADFPVINN